jgi:hypothetical protein
MSSTYLLENQSYLPPGAHWRPFGLAHGDVDLNMGRLKRDSRRGIRRVRRLPREGIAHPFEKTARLTCLTILARRSSTIRALLPDADRSSSSHP